MKMKFTIACCLFLSILLASPDMKAQFFNYLPGLSNYLRSDVRPDAAGLTFSYTWQDSALAIKTILLHTDNSGQVQWMKDAGNNFGSYTIAPDTSVILTGGRSTTGGNRIALLQKMDKSGNVVWKKTIAASAADVSLGNVMVGNNNTIFVTFTRSSFSSSTYYSRAGVAAFDAAGQVLWTKYFANGGFTTDYGFSRSLLAANGDFIGVADIRGSVNAQANGMMVTRITPQGTIRFARYIDFKPSHTQLSVNGLTETPAGHLIFGGRLMTDQISIHPNSMWLARMDSAGNVLQQKVYSGGQDVGELLHGLAYHNGTLHAYLQYISPFDTVTSRSIWIGKLDEQSLSFTTQNATEIQVATEDPYGNVRNSFCMTSDGKPTVSAGFYCNATGKYLPVMMQWSAALNSSCPALDVAQVLTDSVTAYAVTDYTPQSSFTVTIAADTTVILLANAAPVVPLDLCNGCAIPNSTGKVAPQALFRLYPNPGDGRYFIDVEQPVHEARIRIYNNIGAIVYQENLQTTHQAIDLRVQPPGIYYVSISTRDGHTATRKIVKDR